MGVAGEMEERSGSRVRGEVKIVEARISGSRRNPETQILAKASKLKCNTCE